MSHGTQEHLWPTLTFAYGGVTLYAAAFQLLLLASVDAVVRVLQPHTTEVVWFGLFPVRSPLLGESRLISFPPGT